MVCLVCGESYGRTLEDLAAAKGIKDVGGLIRDLSIDLAQVPV